jgi:hypothetical protein
MAIFPVRDGESYREARGNTFQYRPDFAILWQTVSGLAVKMERFAR